MMSEPQLALNRLLTGLGDSLETWPRSTYCLLALLGMHRIPSVYAGRRQGRVTLAAPSPAWGRNPGWRSQSHPK